MVKINKRGNIIGFGFAIISFIFIWAIWLGNYLSQLGADYITNNNPQPVELFFYSNLNLFVAACLFITIFLYFALGGGRG